MRVCKWIIHWSARVFALALVMLLIAFIIGEGGPNPATQPLSTNVQLLMFIVLMPLGLLIGLRWPLIGGVVALAALTIFAIVEFARSHHVLGGVFPFLLVPPALYLVDALLRPRRYADVT